MFSTLFYPWGAIIDIIINAAITILVIITIVKGFKKFYKWIIRTAYEEKYKAEQKYKDKK